MYDDCMSNHTNNAAITASSVYVPTSCCGIFVLISKYGQCAYFSGGPTKTVCVVRQAYPRPRHWRLASSCVKVCRPAGNRPPGQQLHGSSWLAASCVKVCRPAANKPPGQQLHRSS
ncbi:hypothetical protein V1264_022770 [Littorina saxatilis]|uniref:Uncharacterized protein n=1 Tax=Littorina saxatilis TaxID=31220 RepID=A0AAN9G9B0_9CAEN